MALMAAVSVRAVDLKTGSFGVLLGQSQVEVVFDFSSVVIDGMTLDDFKSGGRVDEDYENWDDFEVFIKRRFIAGLNRYHAKIPGDIVFRFSGSPCRYTLKVIPAMMNIDGVYSVNFCLTDNDTGETAGTAYGSGDGGVFGCFSNLQGDGFEELGNDFAKFLIKQLRRTVQGKTM